MVWNWFVKRRLIHTFDHIDFPKQIKKLSVQLNSLEEKISSDHDYLIRSIDGHFDQMRDDFNEWMDSQTQRTDAHFQALNNTITDFLSQFPPPPVQ